MITIAGIEIIGEKPMYIDATPTSDYALRILRAYRQSCNSRCVSTTDPNGINSSICNLMNEWQEQRAAILDRAIAILESTP